MSCLLYTGFAAPYLPLVDHVLARGNPGLLGWVERVGFSARNAWRALADVPTWAPLVVGQMRRLGVDSIPIALFIALFTGIVLALLSATLFIGAVPPYFVGALVGKTIMMELGPVLTGMALAGRVSANIAAGFFLGRPGHEGVIPSVWVASAVGGNSLWSNLFASVAGALMYFATLTEVPILQGLLGAGMGKGPALALLLAGPALSLPNMLVIRSVMGTRKTLVFVGLVVTMATISGLIFGALF